MMHAVLILHPNKEFWIVLLADSYIPMASRIMAMKDTKLTFQTEKLQTHPLYAKIILNSKYLKPQI